MKKVYTIILLLLCYTCYSADKFAGALKYPIGLHCSDKFVYCADFTGDTVYKYDLSGTIKARSSKIDGPVSIISNAEGQLLVTSHYEHCIICLDTDLKEVKRISFQGRKDGNLYYPLGIACDTEGKIYVADYGNFRVSIFSSKGAFLSKIVFREKGKSLRPRSIMVKDKQLFIICKKKDQIYVSDLNGNNINIFNNFKQKNQLRHIKSDRAGFLYITDQLENSVSVINYERKMAKKLCSGFSKIEDVCFDDQGNIYITDAKKGILKYTDDFLQILQKIHTSFSNKNYDVCRSHIMSLPHTTQYLDDLKVRCEKYIAQQKPQQQSTPKPVKQEKKISEKPSLKINDKKTPEIKRSAAENKNKTSEKKDAVKEKTKTVENTRLVPSKKDVDHSAKSAETRKDLWFSLFIFVLIVFSIVLLYKLYLFRDQNKNIQKKRKRIILKKRKEYITIQSDPENKKEKKKKKRSKK